MIFEFYEQKYPVKVYLKFNLAQSTKQEGSETVNLLVPIESQYGTDVW